jgi:hypothetical protein
MTGDGGADRANSTSAGAEDTLNRRLALRAFVVAVVVAAALALVALPRSDILARPGLLWVLVGLGALAAVRPVRLPGLRIEMIPTLPVILVGLAALGPMAAVLIGLAGVAGAAVGRGRLPVPIHLVFNLAAVTLSAAAAAGAFLLTGGGLGQELTALIMPLFAATAAYFVANTGLPSAAIALDKRQAFMLTWRKSFSWSPISYLCGFALAVALLAAIDSIAVWALVFGIPMCWLLTASYLSHASTLLRGTARKSRV